MSVKSKPATSRHAVGSKMSETCVSLISASISAGAAAEPRVSTPDPPAGAAPGARTYRGGYAHQPGGPDRPRAHGEAARALRADRPRRPAHGGPIPRSHGPGDEIGRASCRERR